jgi:TonB family protein
MKKYFLHINEQTTGPFSPDELRTMNITSSTKVWFEGLDGWKNAGKIPELNYLFSTAAHPNQLLTPYGSSRKIVLVIVGIAVVLAGSIGFFVYKKLQKKQLENEMAMQERRDKEEKEEDHDRDYGRRSYVAPDLSDMLTQDGDEIVPEVVQEAYDETMPEFPGGTVALNKFIRDNMQYPQSAKQSRIQGTVYVRFTVDRYGNITDPEIIRTVNAALDKEALRLVKKMPRWKPATINSYPRAMQTTQPIRFVL